MTQAVKFVFKFHNANFKEPPEKRSEEESKRSKHRADRDKSQETGKNFPGGGHGDNIGSRSLAGSDHACKIKSINEGESFKEMDSNSSYPQHQENQN